MSLQIALIMLIFWSMQVVASVFFWWGSVAPARGIWGFLIGNLFGMSSIWFLMWMYKIIHPNVALGIATGGAFLFCQIAIFLVSRSKMAPVQWVGIAAIIIGIFVLALGKPKEAMGGAAPKVATARPGIAASSEGQ